MSLLDLAKARGLGVPVDECSVFIDTGCADGNSLEVAIADGAFVELHGIDISERCVASARARLSAYLGVQIHHGTSPDVLPHIIRTERRTLFWLDAHWQGRQDLPDELDAKYGQCPLWHELRAILGLAKMPVIMIDDCSIFCGEKWWSQYGENFDALQWPKFHLIYDLLHPDFTILIRDEVLYAW